MLRSLGVLAALLQVPCLAPTAQAQADVAIDATDLHVSLGSSVDRSGRRPRGVYQARFAFQLLGADVEGGDAVRVRLRQGRQVLAELRCPVRMRFGGGAERSRCQTEDALDQSGEIRLEMVYVDQTTDEETLLHDATLEVVQTWQWIGMDGRRPVHVASFQVRGDDRLGLAFFKQVEVYDGPGRLHLLFWTSHQDAELPRGHWNLRCRNGEDTPWAGFRVTSVVRGSQPSLHAQNRVRIRDDVRVENLYWSRYLAQVEGIPFSVASSGVTLRDHGGAGDWRCELRRDGVAIRGLRFRTNDRGQVLPHAAQSGTDGLRTSPGIALLDVRFPTRDGLGPSFDPARIRASYGLGRPWPDGDAVAPQMAALPRTTVRPTFTTPRGARRRRR